MRYHAKIFISSVAALTSGALFVSLIGSGCKAKDERLPQQTESQEEVSVLPTAVSPPLAVLPPPPVTDPKKVALGGQLFFDTRLSGDYTLSCASCHALDTGGTDAPLRTSTGINAQFGPINSPTVYNSHLNLAQFWDGRAATLEEQAAGPVENPLEMGAAWPDVLERLRAVPAYVEAFKEAYGQEITTENATHAIAEYERTLMTPSRFDRFGAGDVKALTEQEREGLKIFIAVGCTTCHTGPLLGGQMFQKMGLVHDYFAARGGELTEADYGRFNFTKREAEKHFFKVPTLRNVELTPPYFHDGHAKTLEEAVNMMALYQLARNLTVDETTKIVAFLKSLTGESFPSPPDLKPPPHTEAEKAIVDAAAAAAAAEDGAVVEGEDAPAEGDAPEVVVPEPSEPAPAEPAP